MPKQKDIGFSQKIKLAIHTIPGVVIYVIVGLILVQLCSTISPFLGGVVLIVLGVMGVQQLNDDFGEKKGKIQIGNEKQKSKSFLKLEPGTEECPICNGTGNIGKTSQCFRCKGNGSIDSKTRYDFTYCSEMVDLVICPFCRESGIWKAEICIHCRGSGKSYMDEVD